MEQDTCLHHLGDDRGISALLVDRRPVELSYRLSRRSRDIPTRILMCTIFAVPNFPSAKCLGILRQPAQPRRVLAMVG